MLDNKGISQVRFEDLDFMEYILAPVKGNVFQIVHQKVRPLSLPPQPSCSSTTTTSAVALQYVPLTAIFYTPKDPEQEKEWTQTFMQSFNVTPARFLGNEQRLKERCAKFSVPYSGPQLEDSIEATFKRKMDMDAKCKAVADKARRDCQRELSFKRECEAHHMYYQPPTSSKETAEEKRIRRGSVRKQWRLHESNEREVEHDCACACKQYHVTYVGAQPDESVEAEALRRLNLEAKLQANGCRHYEELIRDEWGHLVVRREWKAPQAPYLPSLYRKCEGVWIATRKSPPIDLQSIQRNICGNGTLLDKSR
eukprot:scaffold9474_cov148-Skeletonema_dohrnii-CCMP3373.AAC.6